jgi:hypothetical protein
MSGSRVPRASAMHARTAPKAGGHPDKYRRQYTENMWLGAPDNAKAPCNWGSAL